jgi:hypothetical protein
MTKFFFVITVIFCIACNGKKEEKIIEQKEMMTIMKELALAEDFVTQYVMKDSTKKHKPETMALYNKIFTLHKTDSKVFMRSFDYYISQPKESRNMFDSLVNELRRYDVAAFDSQKKSIDSLKLIDTSKKSIDTLKVIDSTKDIKKTNRFNKMKGFKNMPLQSI